jgi:hypothetical protein
MSIVIGDIEDSLQPTTIGESEYESTTIAIDPVDLRQAASSERTVARYPQGSSVEVFYNPKDPTQAVLDRSTPSYGHYMWIVFLVFTILILGVGAVTMPMH